MVPHQYPLPQAQVLRRPKSNGSKVMKIEANTLYLADPMAAMRHLAPSSIDLLVADTMLMAPPEPVGAATLHGTRNEPAPRAPRTDPLPLLAEAKRLMKLFNAFFFVSKNQLPIFMAFAQQQGLAWDLLVWEHGFQPSPTTPNADFIITLWERGVYFNPDLKASFFQKVKHHPVGKNRTALDYAAEKPRKLMLEFVQQRSKPGMLVLGLACGVGNLPIACLETGRAFIAFEHNETHYNEAKQNLEKAALSRISASPENQLQLRYGQ